MPCLDQMFEVGPQQQDLLRCRPYFLYNVDVQADGSPDSCRETNDAVTEHIAAYAAKVRPTDVFVCSHGWHRNLFRSFGAYDRLASRFMLLMRRGRLGDSRQFRPMLVNLHWNSDFDADSWVDIDGRKRRSDFVKRVCEDFEPKASAKGADLVNFAEDVFEYLTASAAPDIDPLDAPVQDRSKALFDRLDDYQLTQMPDVRAPHETAEDKAAKVVQIWTDYHESQPQGATSEQHDPATSYVGPVSGILRAATFISRVALPVIGFGVLLGPTKGLISSSDQALRRTFLWHEFLHVPARTIAWALVYLVLYLLASVTLHLLAARNRAKRRQHDDLRNSRDKLTAVNRRNTQASPLPPYGIAAWIVMQVPHALLVLGFCVLTYPHPAIVFGATTASLIAWLGGYIPGRWLLGLGGWLLLYLLNRYGMEREYDEREGKRGNPPGPFQPSKLRNFRASLTSFGRYPAMLAHEADVPASKVYGMWDMVISQLGILHMQMKAVLVGRRSAEVLTQLFEKSPEVRSARLHIVGHSFGGVVVVNLARHLAHQDVEMQSLTTIQGALGSDWYVGENTLLRHVNGCIAAVYTKYDTATGALFSLGMGGRNGIGSVGASPTCTGLFRRISDRVKTYHPLPSASLSSPPDLYERLALAGERVELSDQAPVLNIDASRFYFEGAVASGGAHDDIFKSETIHTMFAIASFERPPMLAIAITEQEARKERPTQARDRV